MSEITVLGIFVADISFSGPKIPSIGETILGKNIMWVQVERLQSSHSNCKTWWKYKLYK